MHKAGFENNELKYFALNVSAGLFHVNESKINETVVRNWIVVAGFHWKHLIHKSASVMFGELLVAIFLECKDPLSPDAGPQVLSQ